MKAIDVHGFGGGFTLGAVQAGFELTAKFSRSKGFGVYNTLANRHLLGDRWDSITGAPDEWEPMQADAVIGNPPCSGFSTLSRADFRGLDSAVNDYMWELINYAGLVAPPLVIWESVQQTFRQGIPLLRQLHQRLEELSEHKYGLWHVLHNNASVGGVSTRRRYFFVASRMPFGVDHYPLEYVPQFKDALVDLLPLSLTMQAQPYKSVRHLHTAECMAQREECHCPVEVLGSSRWAREHMHDGTGMVDGHDVTRSPSFDRVEELCREEEWFEGESISEVLRRYYGKHGKLPRGWYYPTTVDARDEDGNLLGTGEKETLMKADQLIRTDFAMGHNQQVRWHWEKLARVITGGACHLVLHPKLPRTLTQREAARIQGFPDAWKIWPVRHAPDLGPGWGKGVPVHAGKWIAEWGLKALGGTPGPITGVPLHEHDRKLGQKFGLYENELVVDLTNDYKPFALAFGDRG